MQVQGGAHVGRGIACAFVGGVLWGFSGNCAEVLMLDYGLDVLWMTPARMFVAAALFLAVALVRDRARLAALLHDGRTMLRLVAYGVFGVLFMQVTYLYAIRYAGAGTALTLEQLCLLFVLAYVCAKGRRLPNGGELAGIAFAAAGVVCIATQGDPANLHAQAAGIAWGVASGLAMALYNILPMEPLERYGTPIVNGVGLLIGAVVCSAFTHPWTYDVRLPLEGWAVFAGLAVVGTFVAYFLYIQGVNDAGPLRASLLACSEPVTGTFVSAIWVGTAISTWDVAGLVLIVAMVFLVVLSGRKRPSESKPAETDSADAHSVGRCTD